MGIATDIVKDIITRFPDTPTKTLARKLYVQSPEVFTTLEAARARIRYYRGESGTRVRKHATSPKKEGARNPFDMLPEPLTDYVTWEHHVLGRGKWLILADTHIPYYRKEEFVIALKAGLAEKVDGLVLLGDIADFYSCSFWVKDPRRRDFQKERDALLMTLRTIRELYPSVPIIYKLGNHEERLERYLRVKAPELLDVELLSFEAIIQAEEFKITVVKDRRLIKMGRLYLLHGHEFGTTFFSPVNPARGLYLRGKEIALCAHYHQTSQHTEKSLADTITSCWSIGGLCDLHPEYRPLNKWNFGFAIVDNQDEFVVHNKKIINGHIY